MNEDQQSSSLSMGTILTHRGVVPGSGVLGFGDDFDSCITATLTLFLSSTTPSSVSLFPIPLALSCRTLNVLSGIGLVVVIAGTLAPSRCRRSNHFFFDTGMHLRFQNISRAPIQSIWCTCSSLHQTDTACAWLVATVKRDCANCIHLILSLRRPGPLVFCGSPSCDPAAWLAERQLLVGESNPGLKPTLKPFYTHSLNTLIHQSNPLNPPTLTLPSPLTT